MTDMTVIAAPARTPPLSVTLTAVSAILLGAFALFHAADTRMIDGISPWSKPLKFALSFVVYFATFVWLETRLSEGMRAGRMLRWTMAAMAVAFLGEMAYMTAQAAQLEHSHFNLSTSFHRTMYMVMGVGAATLVAGAAVYAFAAARDSGARLSGGLRAGVVWGFALTFGLTFVVAGYLSSQTGHFVGTPSEGAATLPLFGWSAEVGDLRPAHFLSIHAIHALPLLGWAVSARADAKQIVWFGAVAYTILTLAVFAQALMGLPLIRL